MINVFKIGGKIGIDGADKAYSTIEKLAKKASSLASTVEKGLSTAAKIGTAAVSIASAGVVALTKAAVEEYANYEQLVGGVDTLFKESSEKVQKYAADAYKTAGLSANDYMETVTSFSASLLQSLGDDTEAAAEKADMAITDMSDNANKMGTDMSSIQNAYQGFAKQNYTMLDNLKLGYGGTKEEMQRLLDDANKLNKAQGKYTAYSIESYADIVDAIHVVQTEMGITGTTAKEASTTIQGSVNSAKAAWHNLLIGVADDNQDFDRLVDEFVDSIYTAADNILPRVSKSLDGILKLVNTVAKKVLPSVIQEISAQLPSLVETGAEIVVALGEGIVNNLDAILGAAEKVIKKVIPKLATAFKELVPKIAKSAANIIKELDGMVEAVGGVYLAFKSLTKGNWIGVGIGLFITALGQSRKAAAETRKEIMNLTDAEWDMIEAGQEAADALYAVLETRDENIGAIELETQATQDLWAELQTLVDENGHVIEGNEDRVDYILNDLNDALGTEYQRNGKLIEQYQTMQTEIDKLIKMQLAKSLIENGKEAYEKAVVGRDADLAGLGAATAALENAQAAYDAAEADLTAKKTEQLNHVGEHYYSDAVSEASDVFYDARDALKKAQADYDELAAAANKTVQTITRYEQAYAAFQQGNYEEAAALMTQDTVYRWQHVNDVKKISEEEKAQLQSDLDVKQHAVDAAREAYKKGTEGYTQELLSDMEAELEELATLWEEASGEAYDAGANIALGLVDGMTSQTVFVGKRGGELVSGMINSMRAVAEIASPSKVTRKLGQFLGVGLGLGVEDETDDVVRRASGLMNSALGAMSGQNIGTISAAVSGGSGGGVTAAPVSININVHADTDDLGSKIASELQVVLDEILAARGNIYRNGRTNYAY